jgi:hypothetical protein
MAFARAKIARFDMLHHIHTCRSIPVTLSRRVQIKSNQNHHQNNTWSREIRLGVALKFRTETVIFV